MSKAAFLQSVGAARGRFVHRVETEHPGPDPAQAEGQLARGAIWLTPSTVKGFKARDYSELSPDDRAKLQDAVERFLRIAKQAPTSRPPRLGHVQEAMPVFQEILELTQPYFPESPETAQIREILERIRFPDYVLTYDIELGMDWTGDPATWIYVFVKDEVGENDQLIRQLRDIHWQVFSAITQAGIPSRPFIRFRTASEQRAL